MIWMVRFLLRALKSVIWQTTTDMQLMKAWNSHFILMAMGMDMVFQQYGGGVCRPTSYVDNADDCNDAVQAYTNAMRSVMESTMTAMAVPTKVYCLTGI